MEKFVGHIGLGHWGKNILRNLYEMKVIRVACDTDEKVLNERSFQFPDITYTADTTKVISDPLVKAVTIATPASTHYEIAKKSLIAGKDVFVEKPLALTLTEAEELLDIADSKGLILMVGHILQYHPAIKKLKELISLGDLGRVQYLYSNRLNIGRLRTEENILWSFAPHDISVMCMLVGEDPIRVSAVGGDFINRGIYDTTITILEFPNGLKAHIFVSWLHPFKEQKLIVVGSKAMAVFDDLSREKLFIYPHKIEWTNGKIPVAYKAEFIPIPVEQGEPLRLELEHFISCVLSRKRPLTDGREAIRVLRVIDASERSIASGGVFVRNSVPLSYFAHETAIIDNGVEIGYGTKIWHFSHILKGSKIGKNCVLGQNVMVGPDVIIGDGCKIQNNVSIYKGVKLEDNVFCGPSCVFTNVYNPRAFISRMEELKPTLVKEGATIGANSTIVCGVKIGRFSLVAAGAVVTRDVPDYALVSGVPARHTGWVCKCGVVLINKNEIKGNLIGNSVKSSKILCPNCGSIYLFEGDTFSPLEEKI